MDFRPGVQVRRATLVEVLMPRILARITALTLLVISLAPATARAAQGVNLAWDHCLAEGTGVQNKQFACDTNMGLRLLVGAFQLGSTMNQVIETTAVLQLASASAALPAWWEFQAPGGCRPGALLPMGLADPIDAACPVWWGDEQPNPGRNYCTSSGPGSCLDRPTASNEARIKAHISIPVESAATLLGGQEYFSFSLRLLNAETVGLGACAGCETPVCIVFNSLELSTPEFNERRTISTASVPGGTFVTWQGGGPGCPGATPSRNATWGSVKSLYR